MKHFIFLFSMYWLMACSPSEKESSPSTSSNIQSNLYQSTDDSHRKDFFLLFEENNVTLYGWEINSSKDSVYYRSTTSINDIGSDMIRFTFEDYHFSKVKSTINNLHQFTPDHSVECYAFLLHNSFSEKRKAGDSYEFIASKSLYDSNCDEFRFEPVNQ